MSKNLQKYFNDLSEIYFNFLNINEKLIIKLDKKIKNTKKNNGIFIFGGNGGSFADSLHISGELTGSLINKTRKPIKSIVLGSNIASLTAISNDFSYENFLDREFNPYSNDRNKLVILFSTSGNSKNIIKLVSHKSLNKNNTFIFTGKNCDLSLNKINVFEINSSHTPHIQELYKIFMHNILINNNL